MQAQNKFGSAHLSLNTQVEFYSRVVLLVLTKCNKTYLNKSFLVKKSNGNSRLVTAFADVGRYSKPQPSLLPDVESTLRNIAKWKHVVFTDVTNAFY